MNPSLPPSHPPRSDSSASEADFAASAEKESSRRPRKRGGFMRKFFILLLLIAAGAAAYVYYNPGVIAIIAPLPPAPTQPAPDDSAPTDSAPDDSAPTASARPAPAVNMPAKNADANDTQIALLSGEFAAMRAQFTRMESRLNQVDAAVRASRSADSANIRLLLVGLLLESNGDTQSAASALRRIADSASSNAESISADFANLIRAEAARMEQTPARARILSQIAELRRLLQKPSESGVSDSAATTESGSFSGAVGDFMRGAFNVSRRDSGGDAPGRWRENILNHLARMEFYLAANNRVEYRNSLESASRLWAAAEAAGVGKSEGGDGWSGANIDLKFRILREFGAPDYHLNLPLDKP